MTKKKSSSKSSTKKKSSSSSRKKSSSSKKKNQGGVSVTPFLLVVLILGGGLAAYLFGVIDTSTFEDIVVDTIGDEVQLDGSIPQLPNTEGEEEEQAATPTRRPAAPVSGEWYQVHFTNPQFPDEEATRQDNVAEALIDIINSAQSSIDMAIYELNRDNIGDAILAARDRGVQVRLVTDSDELEELETLIHLEEEGIPIITDERRALMHNKFVVIDQQAVWTGSWNMTPNGSFRNNNHAIYIQSPELAENYLAEFNEMFVDEEFGPTSSVNTINPRVIINGTLIETCFAPEDECGDKLVVLVRQAQKSIRFMAFSFTHDAISEAVRDRGNDDIIVQGIFETRGSETDSSEYNRMRRRGMDVLQDGNPYTFHHKAFIIDDETVVLGSFNFSNNADNSNDENILIVHNADIAQQFLNEFERVYAQAQNPPNR